MRYLKSVLTAVCIALFFYCSGNPEAQLSGLEPLTDVVTLELTFGDKDLPDEYLLANPRGIAVNEDGDIYVLDEYKLKVYDSGGKEKTLIGRRGEGPAEFRAASGVWIGPSGLIAAGSGSNYNLYSSDNVFITKHVFRNSRIFNKLQEEEKLRFSPGKIIPLNESYRILGGSSNSISGDVTTPLQRKNLLVNINDDSVSVVANYNVSNRTGGAGGIMNHPYLGDFHWDYLSNNRLVYTHTGYDKTIDEVESSYTLFLIGLDDSEKLEISIPYQPVEIPDSLFEKNDLSGIMGTGVSIIIPYITADIQGRVSFDSGDILDRVKDDLREAKYLPPISALLTDREFIFLFIYHPDFPGQVVAQVVESITGRHISTVLFPAKPSVIRNGYAYVLKTGRDIFPVVEKYKIDPAVYGK